MLQPGNQLSLLVSNFTILTSPEIMLYSTHMLQPGNQLSLLMPNFTILTSPEMMLYTHAPAWQSTQPVSVFSPF
jgi:hypothetical protein